MNKESIPRGWKKSYWPEPRLGRSETRREVIQRLHPSQKEAKVKPKVSLDDAMSLLMQMACDKGVG